MSSAAPSVPPPNENWAGAAPAQTLAYSSITYGRPGLVTGLGVTSIVIASISLLASLWSGLMYVPLLMMSGTSMAASPLAPTATTPANTLAKQDADLIAAALASRQLLSSADQAALAGALMLAESPIVPPPDGQWTPGHVTQQITGTSSWSSGATSSASFTLNSGSTITIAGGSVTFLFVTPGGSWTTTSVTNGVVSSSTSTPFGGAPGADLSTIILGIVSVVLSLGLAVLLLIAGIQTARGLPSGRTLHLWWAWPKLAVAALGALATYRFWNGTFFGGMGGAPLTVLLALAGGSFAFAIAWPIVVLLLLRTRALRAYYGPAETAA